MQQEVLSVLLKLLAEDNKIESKSEQPFKIGEKYFFRTITYHVTGKVKSIVGHFLVLEDAAWVADSGRFRQAIMEGVLDEVEPVDVEMYLNLESITDAFQWKKDLPRVQK